MFHNPVFMRITIGTLKTKWRLTKSRLLACGSQSFPSSSCIFMCKIVKMFWRFQVESSSQIRVNRNLHRGLQYAFLMRRWILAMTKKMSLVSLSTVKFRSSKTLVWEVKFWNIWEGLRLALQEYSLSTETLSGLSCGSSRRSINNEVHCTFFECQTRGGQSQRTTHELLIKSCSQHICRLEVKYKPQYVASHLLLQLVAQTFQINCTALSGLELFEGREIKNKLTCHTHSPIQLPSPNLLYWLDNNQQ